MNTSDAGKRFASRLLSLKTLLRRGENWTTDRRVLTGAAVIVLTTAAIASVALASPDSTPAKAKPAAAAQHTNKPSYLRPIGSLIANGLVPKPSMAGDTGKTGVPAGTPPVPTSPNTTDVGQRSQSIAGYQGGSGTMTPAGIATLAIEHGCSPTQAVTATAIAMAESGGSPSAQGDIALMDATWDWSAGLWQIRGLRAERHTGALRDSIANQSATKNATAMYTISSGCNNWTPWSTYNTGAYAQYMGIATQAAKYVVAYYNTHGHHFPAVAAPNPNSSIPSQSSTPGHTLATHPGSTNGSAAGHAPSAPTTGARAKATSAAGHPAKSGDSTKVGGGGAGGGGGGTKSSTGAGSKPSSGASTSKSKKHGNPVTSILPTLPPVKSILPTLPPVKSILPLPTLTPPHL